MKEDILKDFFDSKRSQLPKDDFEQRLIANLTHKIAQYERRRKIATIFAVVFSIGMLFSWLIFYTDYLKIEFSNPFPAIPDINPIFAIEAFFLFLMLSIFYYFQSNREIKRLKESIENMK